MTNQTISEYIPEDQWPAVSVMLEGFGAQTLPPTSDLAGTTLILLGDEGSRTTYAFHSSDTLMWETSGSDGIDSSAATCTYKAIEARDGIFIVDFVTGEGQDARDITMIYDRNRGIATTGTSSFVPTRDGVRSVTRFVHSTTPETSTADKHERSAGLVGKRIYYRYSDTEAYEHIYLSPGTYTWHCIRGGERGLADTDKCMAFEVAEDLYIFFWTEKVMTVEAVLLLDLREQRSIGRMFGWDAPTDKPVVLPFNSRLTVLNTTEYPTDHQKS